MPRPRIDTEEIRERLLEEAEQRLRRLGSLRFSVTDLAADCRMSQSNVYRFFPNKAALMAALAQRWFADVEAELRNRISAAKTWQAKLNAFVRVQLVLKSARFDEDPELFRAYLKLAEDHPEPVGVHVARLQEMLEDLLGIAFEGDELSKARHLVEDATQMFRDPFVIARLRPRCDPDRATAVINAVVAELENRLPDGVQGNGCP